GSPGGLAGRSRHQSESQGTDRIGAQNADAARGEGHQDAVRRRRRQRAHARRGRPELRGHPRAHPTDRGQGAPQAAPSVAEPEAARVPRGTDVVKLRRFASYFLLPTSYFILPLGPIAQRLEPPAHNRPVPGSNPGGPTFALGLRRELRRASPCEGVRRSLGEGGPSLDAEREGAGSWVRESFGWQAFAPGL